MSRLKKPAATEPATKENDDKQAATMFVAVTNILPCTWNGGRKADKELIASVKERGVLQPLLLRPVRDTERASTMYQVVCGSRRLSAAIACGLAAVPAMIKEMGDDAAHEATLIENIHRQSVTAFEESVAICYLLKSAKVRDVAARIGKSTGYIAECRAIAAIEPKVRAWVMKFAPDAPRRSLAAIATLGADQQLAFMHHIDCAPETINDPDILLSEFQRFTTPLGDACPFDQADASLNPERGACSDCQFRTSSDKDLFKGLFSKQDKCGDPACYAVKRKEAFVRKINAAIEKNPKGKLCTMDMITDPVVAEWAQGKEVVRASSLLKTKKGDPDGEAYIVIAPDAMAGKVVHLKPIAKQERSEPNKPRGAGPEMLIRRRFAYMIGKTAEAVRKGTLANKYQPPLELLRLVEKYGAERGDADGVGGPA